MGLSNLVEAVSLSITFFLFALTLASAGRSDNLACQLFYWVLAAVSFVLGALFTVALRRTSIITGYRQLLDSPRTSKNWGIASAMLFGILWLALVVGAFDGTIKALNYLPESLHLPTLIALLVWSGMLIAAILRRPLNRLFRRRRNRGAGYSGTAGTPVKVEESPKESPARGVSTDVLRGLIYAALLWLAPFLGASALICALGRFGWLRGLASYTSVSQGFVRDILPTAGVIVAVLFAILTWVHGESRQKRYTGHDSLRHSVRRLQLIAIQMGRSVNRASPQNAPILQQWQSATDDVVRRLNLVTHEWGGWDSDPALETELADYVAKIPGLPSSVGQFIAGDDVWCEIHAEVGREIRDVLHALVKMDEGQVDTNFRNDLHGFMWSIVLLVCAGVVFGFFFGGINIAASTRLIASSSFALSVVAHLLWLVARFATWRRTLEGRERTWRT